MTGSKKPKRPAPPIEIDQFDAEVGKRVRALRESREWSQARLAAVVNERAGLAWHQTTVGKIESGERPLRLVEASVISRVLYATIDDLAQGGLEQKMDELIARDFELLRMSDFIQRRRDQLYEVTKTAAQQLLDGYEGTKLSDEGRAIAEAIVAGEKIQWGESDDKPREEG